MKYRIILTISLLVLLGAAAAIFNDYQQKNEQQQISDETVLVKKVVSDFGTHLKNVPLTADASVLVPVIKKEYAAFVSQALLDRFVEDPTHAPGREVSSPWPERIEIKSVEKRGDYYEVEAEIVYMTSVESSKGGDAGRSPVYLTVANIGGEWRIAEYQTSME